MAITAENVYDALKKVKHPESSKDIVALEMIEELEISDKKIKFNLKFNKVKDPFANSIKNACISAIKNNIDNKIDIEINLIMYEPKKAEESSNLKDVKNIIAIASGKGGVGKSTIAANLAVATAKLGYSVGLIDADIYGPSTPIMLNITNEQPEIENINGHELIVPVKKYGVKVMSIGFFVSSGEPIVWRGPMASNALKQLFNSTKWEALDYLFIDLPPGTSDIHLTTVQTVAITGVVIVSTPQKVALADVIKGINMFKNDNINVPILGLVENMAWFTPEELPNNKYYIFGKEGCKQLAEKFNVPLLGSIPIVQSICESGDNGIPIANDTESILGKSFAELAKNMIEETKKRNNIYKPTNKVQINK